MRCVVHDPTAYVFGGISGNAGLFSTHNDLLVFMQMMMRKGIHIQENGLRLHFFKESTVDLFTTKVEGLPYNNTRALGWDTVPEAYPSPCG